MACCLPANRIIAVVTLVSVLGTMALSGCCPTPWYVKLSSSGVHTNGLLVLGTDDGTVSVTSDSFGCSFQISVDGALTNRYVVTYSEEDGRAAIGGFDPENRLSSFSVVGTPEELQELAQGSEVAGSQKSIIGATIVLAFTVAAIALAQVNFIRVVSEMQVSHVTNFVGVQDGKPLMHISIHDFVVDHLWNQVKAGRELLEIALKVICFPASASGVTRQAVQQLAVDATRTFVADRIEDLLVDTIGTAIAEMGATVTEQLTGETMLWIALDYTQESSSLERIFCSYSLYLDDPREVVPATPRNLVGTWNANTAVDLTWDAVDGAEGYIVYEMNAKGAYERLSATSQPGYSDAEASTERAHSYKVRAWVSAIGCSGYSEPCTVDVPSPEGYPEMGVRQGTTAIPDGTGSCVFANTKVGSFTEIEFVVENSGTGDLELTGSPRVAIVGADAAQFAVSLQPQSPVAPSGSTTFSVRFAPTSTGTKNATVSIASNDSDENPYDFAVSGLAELYATSFSSDPGWETSAPSQFYWDSVQEAYYVHRININGGGNYAVRDVGVDMASRSFRLEWDVYVDSIDYASDLRFGLFDTDMNSDEHGSVAWVYFNDEDRGNQIGLVSIDSDDVVSMDTSAGTQFSMDTWYHVVMSYDASASLLDAVVTVRNTGATVRSLFASDAGPFDGTMDRVGLSDIRAGSYQVPGAEAYGYVDNVTLSIP